MSVSYFIDPLDYWRKRVASREPGVHAARLFGKKFWMVTGSSEIEQVLVRSARSVTKGPVLNRISEVLGAGLLTAEGDDWKRSRLATQPFFTRDQVTQDSELLRRAASDWVNALPQQGSFSLVGETIDLLFDCLYQLWVGPSTPEERAGWISDFEEVTRYFEWCVSPLGFIFGDLNFLGRCRYKKAAASLHRRVQALPEVRMKALDLSRRDDRTRLLTLFFAGHETSAVTTAFCLYLMARHPERCEGVSTHAIVQETLRLFPPVWSVVRQAEVEMTVGGKTILPGEMIIVPVFGIHRDDRRFDSAGEFLPSRWAAKTPEEVAALRRSYFPFGRGPRMCVGEGLAWMEIEAIVDQVRERLEFTIDPCPSVDELALLGTITLRPKADLRFSFRKK